MKNIILLFLVMLIAGLEAQEQTCYTKDQAIPHMANLEPDPLDGCYPFSVYVEVDYPLYLLAQSRGVTIESHIEGYLEEERKLFEADGLQASFIVFYWKTPSPYNATTSGGALDQFRTKLNAEGGHPGNLAKLLSNMGSGGVNYVDVLCNNSFGVGYSSINLSYRPYPEYSWDLMVFAHEVGHGLGSPHTHSCSWPGGAIDGCSPFGVEGSCDDPGLPARGSASIMSYCHLQSSVGIDPAYGFGPLPLTLIRNKIAGATCVECVDDPDDPIIDTCDNNQIIIEILVDLWAQETSWEVFDADGVSVGESDPYPKFPVNHIYTDTLCLPDGCYSFVINDIDGLIGRVADYEGLYIVNGPNSELASGQSFTNSETTRFCLGVTPPDGNCSEIILRKDSLIDYANQSRFPNPTITDVGDNGVEVYGNNWRALPYEYELTPFSVLTAEVWVETVGEIQGIALVDNVRGLFPDRSFRFAGTQNWGIAIEQVPVSGWHTITINVGQYFTGNINHIVLVNDDDVRGVVRTAWRNVEICEAESLVFAKSLPSVQGTPEDEDWDDTEFQMQQWVKERAQSLRPNPVSDTLYFPICTYKIYNVFGQMVREGMGNKTNVSGLEPGAYFFISDKLSRTIIKN